MIIRRIDILSAAKVGGIIGLAIGLLVGLLFFLVSSIGGMAALAQQDASMGWAAGLGLMAIIVFPIMYAIFGFIGGAIQAFVYNIAAKFVGGIRFETD